MSDTPLMPKATAVWLVENTSLTFDQIAEFCKLHPLEVKGIADGEVATGIKGYDPISTGQLTREEIAAAEQDSQPPPASRGVEGAHARIQEAARRTLYAAVAPAGPAERGPVAIAQPSRAQGRADHAPRRHDQTHACRRSASAPTGIDNLQPMDPVTLGLCSQIDLDFEVNRAAKDKPKIEEDRSQTLVSAEITTAKPRRQPARSVRRAEGKGRSKRRSTSTRCSAS